jgi:hypothetical protein
VKLASRLLCWLRPAVLLGAGVLIVAGTEIPLDMCEEGRSYSELEAGHWTRKEKGGEQDALSGASDTTEALVNALTTDNFILVPNPRECDPTRNYRVVFRAKTS